MYTMVTLCSSATMTLTSDFFREYVPLLIHVRMLAIASKTSVSLGDIPVCVPNGIMEIIVKMKIVSCVLNSL